MGVMKGLSLDGINYFSDIVTGNKTPNWMDFSGQIARLTGNYKIINYMSGYANLARFLFRTPRWPIGGYYFDGIMRTEHNTRVRTTQYPVQTGVIMTDHAVIEPCELSIEVMMTNAATSGYLSSSPSLQVVYLAVQKLKVFSNVKQYLGGGNPVQMPGEDRCVEAWKHLRLMQIARVPITVETRLQTYENMIIEELSVPDDVKTLNALKCSVRLREIIFANVAEVKTSARAAATTGDSSSGNIPAETKPTGSALSEILKAMRT